MSEKRQRVKRRNKSSVSKPKAARPRIVRGKPKTETTQLLIKMTPTQSQGERIGFGFQVGLIPYKKLGDQHAAILNRDAEGNPTDLGTVTTLQEYDDKLVDGNRITSWVFELTPNQKKALVRFITLNQRDLVNSLNRVEIERVISQTKRKES